MASTVRELIEYLQKFDPEVEVQVLGEFQYDNSAHTEWHWRWIDLKIPELGGYSDTIVYSHFLNTIFIGDGQ